MRILAFSYYICTVQNNDIISIVMKNVVMPTGEMIFATAIVQYKLTENQSCKIEAVGHSWIY